MSNISQLQNIIKSWDIEKKQQKKIQELKQEVSDCSEILRGIREELIRAYIVSNKIIIEEEDEYHVMTEQYARNGGKKDKDLDKKQRTEKQILNDIYRLCEIKENIIHEGIKVESKEDRKFYDKASSNVLYKIVNMLKKLLKKWIRSNLKQDAKEQDILSSDKAIDKSLEMVKLYKDELKQRATKIKGIKEIQEEVNRYNSRIIKDPKKYNKEKLLTLKV